MTATIDAPVLVRYAPWPIVTPTAGESVPIGDPLDAETFDVLVTAPIASVTWLAPRSSDSVRVSPAESSSGGLHESGSSASYDDDLASPVTVHEHTDLASVVGGEVVLHADARQVRLSHGGHDTQSGVIVAVPVKSSLSRSVGVGRSDGPGPVRSVSAGTSCAVTSAGRS